MEQKFNKFSIYNQSCLKQQSAFTLFELIVTVAIITTLSLIAMPMVQKYLQDSEATHVKQILAIVTKDAQLLSFSYRTNLIVCPADNNNQCNRMAKDKIIIFTDRDNNQRFDGNEELVKEYPLGIKYGNFEMRMSLHRHYMKYFGDSGHPRGHFGHFLYCSPSSTPKSSYKIVVSHIGYVSEQRGCL